MNNQSPLIPQGFALEQKNKGRARVKIAVFFVLAIHGIGLMALLMQGCGQSQEPAMPSDIIDTNPPPAFAEPLPPPPETTNMPPVVVTAPAPAPAPDMTALPPAAPAGETEYTIVKGDYLEKIAKNFHVTTRALLEANPGVEPTRLQIGQKIKIPAPTATATPTAPAESATTGGEQVYTVKSGDTLIGIAKRFGTTVKAISAANGLRTTSIKVGQKLTIPVKAAPPVTAPVAPLEPAPPAYTPPPGQ